MNRLARRLTRAQYRPDFLASPDLLGRLVGVYGVSRLIGLSREIATAAIFGTTATADRINTALAVASVASIIVGESTYATCVHELGKAADGPERHARFATLFRSTVRGALIATGVYVVVAPVIAMLILGEFPGHATLLVELLAPSVFAYALTACMNAQLTLQGRFVLFNGVQILYSLCAVAALVVVHQAAPAISSEALAAGWSIGNIAAAAILFAKTQPLAVRAGSAVSARLAVAYGAPVAAAYALITLQALSDRGVASRLGTGSVAALGYGDRLFLLPTGFVIAALAPIVLGALTTAESSAVRGLAIDQLSRVASLVIPVALLFTGIAPLLIELLFQHGAFSEASSDLTVSAADGLCVSLASTSLTLILVRVMQAAGTLRPLVLVAAGALVANLALSIAGALTLDLFGVTLATAVVAFLSVLVQIRVVGHAFGPQWSRQAIDVVAGRLALTFAATLAIVVAHQSGWISEWARGGLGLLAALVAAALVAMPKNRVQEA